MTLSAIARRYANALFDVTHKNGTTAAARASLSDVRALIDANPSLAKVFASVGLPLQRKRAILDAILKCSTGVAPEVGRLLEALADRDRLSIVGLVADAYEARALEDEKVVHADVVTAVPLAGDREAALATALGRVVGGQVKISARVDPSIIGGVVAKVGSVVFDGSVTTQVQKLKARLAAE